MVRNFHSLSLALVLLLSVHALSAATVVETDICVYGGTSGGVAAVVQATPHGQERIARRLRHTGSWMDFTNIPPATINRTIECSDPLPVGLTNRFYRVRVP